jgi:hypothetical protein
VFRELKTKAHTTFGFLARATESAVTYRTGKCHRRRTDRRRAAPLYLQIPPLLISFSYLFRFLPLASAVPWRRSSRRPGGSLPNQARAQAGRPIRTAKSRHVPRTGPVNVEQRRTPLEIKMDSGFSKRRLLEELWCAFGSFEASALAGCHRKDIEYTVPSGFCSYVAFITGAFVHTFARRSLGFLLKPPSLRRVLYHTVFQQIAQTHCVKKAYAHRFPLSATDPIR